MKTDLSIQMVALTDLKPYERNSRTHSDTQIAQIIASIGEFGWTNPILIDEEKGIIAGEGRYRAAAKMGLAEAPCIELAGLTEAQKRAYVIADNKLALNAGWDEKLLSLEIGALQDMDFDLSLMGFDADELAALLNPDGKPGLTDPDEVPQTPETPANRPGDLWILGPHRLLCGDSTQAPEVARLMDRQMADMIFTDPPYNIDYIGRGKITTVTIENDNKSDLEFERFLTTVFSNCHAYTKAGAGAYIFHASRTQKEFERALSAAGFVIKNQIIWNKPILVFERSDYHWKHEPCFYLGKAGQKTIFYANRKHTTVWDFQKTEQQLVDWARKQKRLKAEGKTTIWSMRRDANKDYVHPTQKPAELIGYALANSSKAGDVILDLFGGSGSTIIACERANRICHMMELDPKYCDVIIERWQNFTGNQAVTAEERRPYHEIKAERTRPN